MSEDGVDYKDCNRVRAHVASLLPFTVLEALSGKPLSIRGVAMCSGMSRNHNIYTAEELQELQAYRGHKVAVPRKIFRLVRGDELCGVIVYSYPPPACYGRRMALPRMTIQEMNKQLSIINRVVIHPKYRTVGLGAKLIHDTLPLVGTQYVEIVAVMAKYSPFAEKAGMKKIAEQETVESVSKVLEVLQESGFDLQLIGSDRYVHAKLENLSLKQIGLIRDVLVKNTHPRFRKEFAASRHEPFGKTSEYIKSVQEADIYKLTKLVKLVGMLSQTKVYLFWENIDP